MYAPLIGTVMDNIVQFPRKTTTESFPLTIDESYEHIENVRRDYCDEVCSDVMEAAFSVLASYGLTVVPNEQNVKYIVFLEEAIKSMVYTTKNLHHNFQELAESLVTLTPQAHKEISELAEEKQLNT
jgi:hypothetical protein